MPTKKYIVKLTPEERDELERLFSSGEEKVRKLVRARILLKADDGSWLDMAEIELSVLSRQCLDQRIPDEPTLVRQVTAWEEARNDNATKVNWRLTTQGARIKLRRLYPSYHA